MADNDEDGIERSTGTGGMTSEHGPTTTNDHELRDEGVSSGYDGRYKADKNEDRDESPKQSE